MDIAKLKETFKKLFDEEPVVVIDENGDVDTEIEATVAFVDSHGKVWGDDDPRVPGLWNDGEIDRCLAIVVKR
jgi:hypothetical protein